MFRNSFENNGEIKIKEYKQLLLAFAFVHHNFGFNVFLE